MTLEPGDILLTGTPAGSRPVAPGRGRGRAVGTRRPAVDRAHDHRRVDGTGVGHRSEAAGDGGRSGRGARRHGTPADRADRRACDALTSVSTATLTSQLQRRGIRSTYFTGLRPLRLGRRLLGYAYTLRYVPQREDLLDQLQAGLNAQKRAVESIGWTRSSSSRPGSRTGPARSATSSPCLPTWRGRHRHRRLCPRQPLGGPHGAARLRRAPHGHARPPTCRSTPTFPSPARGAGHARRSRGGRRRRSDGAARGAGRGGGPGRRLQEEQEAFAERVTAGESIVGLYPLADSRRADFETWRSQHRS